MPNDIFTRAKAYRKKHPRTPWADCVKKCAGKKKAAKKKPAEKKKVAAKKAAPKKRATVGAVGGKGATKLRRAGYEVTKSALSSNYIAKKNGSSYADSISNLVKRLLGDNRKSTKVGTVKKKATTPRKVKVKIKPGKKGGSSITIGSIHKMSQEHAHLQGLETALAKHKELLKTKGMTPGEKAAIRRDIKKYQNNIRASKAHISALKRSI